MYCRQGLFGSRRTLTALLYPIQLMPVFTDQTGRQIVLNAPPRRIVSLVPSQTELLFDLGLQERIVGITKFCVHPSRALQTKTVVGGTKQLRTETIHRLQPDLIIGNKEENRREDIEELEQRYPVWISDIATLNDALTMIRAVGVLTQTQAQAETIACEIADRFAELTDKQPRQRVLYLIWRKPWMAAGKHTFIDEMLRRGGWDNALTESRYPTLDESAIARIAPDWVFLSSEPFPFGEKHIAELRATVPYAKIALVNGEMFSWYGSRLLHAATYLANLHKQLGNG